MKKICLRFSQEEHSRIKAKAAMSGLSLLEVGKRLFLSWEREEDKALALWKRWFEESGIPWELADWGECFYCRKGLSGHKDDCIYLAAKELVEE